MVIIYALSSWLSRRACQGVTWVESQLSLMQVVAVLPSLISLSGVLLISANDEEGADHVCQCHLIQSLLLFFVKLL